MVTSCVAYGCTNRAKKGSGITFHLFPKDPNVRSTWERAVRREGWKPKDGDYICSRHFTPDCFDRTGQTVRLRPGSCPTVFDAFPKHLQKPLKRKRPPPRPRSAPADRGDEVDTVFEDVAVASPTKQQYKDMLHVSQEEVTQLKKKIKILQQSKRRLTKKNKTAQEIIRDIKDQKLMSEEGMEVFTASFSPDIQQLLNRAAKDQKGTYPPELRAFALTLHFYSPSAYEYVRSKFNGALPAERIIREWYSSTNGDPGFKAESLSFLEKLVQCRTETLYCTLIVDDMSIRKHVELVGDKVVGYVDFGTGMHDDSPPEAKNACVYMLVGLNLRLKLPVGYFLIDSWTGAERAELTKQCIEKLTSIGVEVVSLTFDGAASNITMAKLLGADLRPYSEHFSTCFENPCDPNKKVYIILDACHMVKLIRNSLATVSHLFDGDGNYVKWAYIKALEALQRKEGLRLGNKLTNAHVKWEKQKMKVMLAVQALSASVADALEFCENELKLPEFKGASGTARFIRIFDQLFDMLNSRNRLAKSFKAPLSKQNEACWRLFFCKAKAYIMAVKDPKGQPILESAKKTGFAGFLVKIESTEKIFDKLVGQGDLKYILTHKMSQDHEETFFGCIRGRGGYNNNPTAAQFMASYKRLPVQTEVKSSSSGNCAQDIVSILSGTTALQESVGTDVTAARRSPVLQPEDHDYTCRLS